MLEGAELIEDAAKGPDVRRVIVRLRLAHLGGHVVWSALHC